MSKHLCFLWTGDSLTEGYGDSLTISCQGIPGRFLMASINTAGTPTMMHVNAGVSGRLVPQYIDVAKSVIEADPTKYSAVVVSIWSPNIPQGEQPGWWPTQPENLAAMVAALTAFEAWLLERSIVFIPAFVAGSPFEMGSVRRAALQEHIDACSVKWPWLLNLNTPVQDPAIIDGPYIVSTYCDDSTHVNSTGLDLQYSYASTRLMPAFQQAVEFYGFVEP